MSIPTAEIFMRTWSRLLAWVLFAALHQGAFASTAQAQTPGVTVTINYEAAEGLMAALQQTTISDDQIDHLLALRGVQAMVDNTTRYLPGSTRESFRMALVDIVATGQTRHAFRLMDAMSRTADTQIALELLRRNEQRVVEDVRFALADYMPEDAVLDATVYAIIGGVSDGFVLEEDPEPHCFIALDRAAGDLAGISLNILHELYHVFQKKERHESPPRVQHEPARILDLDRLMMAVLDEGTANRVADPLRLRGIGTGSHFALFEDRYRASLQPDRLVESFALFDSLARALHDGTMTWPEVVEEGFSDEGPLYFVGYEMARVIEEAKGRRHLARYFRKPPAQFFIDHDALTGTGAPRLSAGTRSLIEAMLEAGGDNPEGG